MKVFISSLIGGFEAYRAAAKSAITTLRHEPLMAEDFGALPTSLIQDELARAYGVSRQPVQQALLLLKNQRLVRDAPGRGLIVSPLDIDLVRNLYEVRAVLDGLAARCAAEHGTVRAKKDGPEYIARGRVAIESGSLSDQIAADMDFHAFVADLSENPLIGETTAPHWPYLRRVMGEVLRDDEKMPQNIWDEHAGMLDAIIAGDRNSAERLSRQHILRAADTFVARLRAQQDAANEDTHRSRLIRR